ncbi:SSI family serine proteinase inhibitor [Natronoglycomyces albus]|uniref:Subtilisin inhibitor domain-containing protein n=1 Tax=Natronoglycomyces albus TaxID=2811108 RepID=A0A895XUE2_9ACTN|nr:SSI family serine proteinase inhibitor [Natronoglycomyces albus]QSB05278.1 hypothetical protein JQS30_16245 [Natronoglycomyces albus]
MIKQILKVTTATAAAAMIAVSFGATASASSTDSANATGEFNLFVEFNDGSIQSTSVSCPAGSGDPQIIWDSCAQLTAANGHIEAIPADGDMMCTMEVRPATLIAEGTWNGEARSFEHTFSNYCVGLRETGGKLFDSH